MATTEIVPGRAGADLHASIRRMRRRQIAGEPPPPSKGELRRQALAVQELGDRLIAVPAAVLATMALPEQLREAIEAARRISSHGALLRQRRFVARLLRDLDTAPLQQALAGTDACARAEASRFRRAERWRDRLLADGPPAIAALLLTCPGAGRDELTALVDRALAERAGHGAAGAARALFRWLREQLDREPPATLAATAPHDKIPP